MNIYFNYLYKIIAISIAYYLAGRIGLLLTIPPGQATAIWPSSGIALAALIVYGYKYWPAIFIGAVGTSLYHPEVIDSTAIILASAIAVGAALQAVLGKYMVSKAIRLPTTLETLDELIKLQLLGGFSCFVNALIGTVGVWYFGFIETSDLPRHISTWWIGDFLGVIAFTPILVLLFSRQKKGAEVSTRRKAIITLAVLLSFSLVSLAFLNARNQYYEDKVRSFKNISSHEIRKLEETIQTHASYLMSVESLFNASNYVSSKEFEIFTRKLLEAAPEISGISWLPKVTKTERKDFEKTIQEQGYKDFKIVRRFEKNELSPSEEKDIYFPISYVQPYQANKKAHGLDVYGLDGVSKNIRIKPLNNARDTGIAKSTPIFPIVQDEDKYGFIVYHPVYAINKSTKTLEEKRQAHLGYINGIYLIPNLMHQLQQKGKKLGFTVIIKDVENDGKIIYDSRTSDFKEGQEDTYIFNAQFEHKETLDVAGRIWSITFAGNENTVLSTYSWNLWFVITGGTLLTGLLALLTLLMTAQTDVVKRLVNQKTNALQEAKRFQDLIQQTIPDLIFVKDHEFKIVEANPAFLSLYPSDVRHKVIGYTTVEEYPDEQAQGFLAQDKIAMETGYSDTEETIKFPDGVTRTLFTKKVRFYDDKGKVYILGIARDITNIKDMEQELRNANEELEEFAYRTSHDLRAPIKSTVGLLDVIENAINKNKTDQAIQGITHAKKSLDKLDLLVEDILSLTKAKNKKETIEPINLEQIINSTRKKMSALEGIEDISISYETQFDGNWFAQKNRLTGIVENLLSNAIKYYDKNKDNSYIKITLYTKDNDLVIDFEDNGIGIPKGKVDTLFGMFNRLHPKASFGSGLGLYLVKKSALAMGGDISFQGNDEVTLFRLKLPLLSGADEIVT